MISGLAIATVLGAVVGCRYRLAALVLILAVLVAGGIASGLSALQIGASVLMVQFGYVVCSFLRVALTERTEISVAAENNPRFRSRSRR
jgi:hypothetical protein